MVAESNQHYHYETLQQLLDDGLSVAETERIESHLSDCEDCRAELEQIAGDDVWWDETISVLSGSTIGRPIAAELSTWKMLDPSIGWLAPLLDKSEVGKLGRIDRYPIDELIGQGGMGVVLRGTDLELNRPVAIKVLSPHLAGVGAARARFMREAQSAASIVHPSIVPIYGVITDARLPYIVMPYIKGGNLQQRIDREGPLELREVLRIGMQIAEGLTAAHRGGVIHRDIKPSNMLVEEGNGRVLISDFGLARALDDATLTNSGIISGTPQYMSPEQARGDVIDARSDLFSLGSLIYALSTGRPPFRAETPLGVVRKVTETKPKPISQINERMPPWLDRLVAQLMAINVDQRIDSAESAANLLREAHAHVSNPGTNTLPAAIAKSRITWKTTLVFAGLAAVPLTLGLASNLSKPVNAPVRSAGTPHVTTPVAQVERGDWSGQELENEIVSTNESISNLSRLLEKDTGLKHEGESE